MAAMTGARLLASLALLTALTDAVPSVTNLHSVSQTLNTVTLAWDLDPPSPQPTIYTLWIDDLISQFIDVDGENTHTAVDLEPCQTYHFELTPTYEDVDGLSDETTATTEYMTPGSTSNLSYDEASNTLTWTEPSNAMCVDHYSVCWRSQMTSETSCVKTTEPSLPLDMVSGCEEVNVMVKAVAPNGKEGPEESLEFVTPYGDPGAPVNFTVKPLPGFAAALFWDLPEENPACIADTVISETILEGGKSTQYSIATKLQPETPWNDSTLVSDLTACTNYLFELWFISVQDVVSDSAAQNMTTKYVSPGEVEDLDFYTTLDTITVIWGTISDGCLDHFKVCSRDLITLEEKCMDAEYPEIDRSIALTGLSPCRYYEVTVSAVSITGEVGPATPQLVRMQDTAPGSVTHLAAHEVTTHSMLVSYDPPTENPACAFRYVESLLFLPPQPSAPEAGLGYRRRRDPTTAQPPNSTLTSLGANRSSSENHVNDLESCSNYQITVYAISPSQQAGPPTQVEQSTLDEAPLEPSELKTVAKTSSTIAVSWFAPSNRFCVSWYKIRADTEEVQSEEVTIFEDYFAFERTHALSNLAACTEYTVVVQAGNHLGTAEASYQESTLC